MQPRNAAFPPRNRHLQPRNPSFPPRNRHLQPRNEEEHPRKQGFPPRNPRCLAGNGHCRGWNGRGAARTVCGGRAFHRASRENRRDDASLGPWWGAHSAARRPSEAHFRVALGGRRARDCPPYLYGSWRAGFSKIWTRIGTMNHAGIYHEGHEEHEGQRICVPSCPSCPSWCHSVHGEPPFPKFGHALGP